MDQDKVAFGPTRLAIARHKAAPIERIEKSTERDKRAAER
jgi:hypothetical protein